MYYDIDPGYFIFQENRKQPAKHPPRFYFFAGLFIHAVFIYKQAGNPAKRFSCLANNISDMHRIIVHEAGHTE